MKHSNLVAAFGAALAVGGLVSGCGSTGQGPTTTTTTAPGGSLNRGVGTVTFKVLWPARTRLIPAAANSIKFVITRDTTAGSPVLAGTVVDRPAGGGPTATTATLTNVPVGMLVVTASAYPGTGAQGVTQASAQAPVTVAQGQTVQVTLTLQSTIDHFVITPAPTAPATSDTVVLGHSLKLMATALDAQGNMVVVTPANLQWLSSSPSVATVDATGNPVNLNAVAVGPAVVTVTDSESGKKGTVNVTVVPHIFTLTGSLTTVRTQHTATLLPSGKVLIAGQSYGEIYNPSTGIFSATGPMKSTRYRHAAVLLGNGMVLLTGGNSGSATLNTAEIFDPTANGGTGGFISTSGPMVAARESHTATLLPDGRVLIVGGVVNSSTVLSSAELYDPATATFTATGSMSTPRFGHTATLLKNGTVLVAGGDNGSLSLNSAEIYNPTTGTFSLTAGSLIAAREFHTATLLGNGKVLLAGGLDTVLGMALKSAELFDPASNTFAATGSMTTPRYRHTATLLADGMRVLVTGGNDGQGVTATAEIFDPAASMGAGGFGNAGDNLNVARQSHTATLLQNGNVLVAGGDNGTAALTSAEITSQPL